MRFDFCLTEVFGQIDVEKTGYVGINELDDWSTAANIQMNREDWAMILDRYDASKDGKFNFSEFCDLWVPWTEVYKRTMVNRSQTNVSNFKNYTVQTRKLVKDLLYSIATAEENFESNRFKITGGHYNVSHELYDWMDVNKDGAITQDEFTSTLKEGGLKLNEHSVRNLFEQWDKDKNGKIEFGEFHTVNKNAICVDYLHA